jgi:uncharacterized UPF0160 family protein
MDIPMKGLTHSGKFHADDVFSAALLRYLNPDIQIVRESSVPEVFDGIIFDIGGGRFDHHQKGAPVRENGVPYAAFGLLWKEFGASIVGEEEAKRLDENFIQSLDLSDNTGSRNDVADLIGLYYPNWNESKLVDEAFFEAVDLAETVLRRKFAHIDSVKKAETVIQPDLDKQKDGVAILTHHAPWKELVKHTEIDFVIYHSKRGGYCAQAVEMDDVVTDGPKPLKCPFPAAWRGKEGDELKEASGVPTLRFCHNSGFLAAAETIEDAILACRLAQQSGKEKE